MNQPVVAPAEQNEVVDPGLTTIGPVPDVVGINKLVAGTTRKATASVSSFQCTPYGGWNGAGFATDVERFIVLALLPVNY